ncbi:SDR family NAD(P)-dependent oxidoreductase [Sulfuriroseicoccus oceanibius]|uniref:SDR family NAD(P)-dependent oxidoreductase n=2 Tax=Sulfuriroseicoccus oceanibius TaxID=2707525 RepID=A0A6B3L0W4_9BACT|nr:SDR family NAD(P)-dependent oxidoreductase [Sulfuriroseicoccus oceanibius]
MSSSVHQDAPVVVITGGRGGLGSALAKAFAEAGWMVHAPGRDALDVASAESVDAYFSQLGAVDVLVNNAGITRDTPLLKMSEAQWDEVIDVNLNGAARCARAVVRGMVKRRRGAIVNVSSYSALSGPAGQANYAAAKAGLIGFTKALAKEVGGRGVRVNAVLPGFLETKMTDQVSDAVKERARAAHALGQFNTAEQAAEFVVNLVRMDAVSGQVFQLDSR